MRERLCSHSCVKRRVVVPLDRPNVDTDQIIPKQFLKRIERTGFGQFLFNDWRFRPDGSLDPDFELNRPGYENATILLAGRNFGSGSSREHAPWALDDYGFRAIIAPSYADIFYSNCFKNGILPVVLPEEVVNDLMARATERPGYRLTVDLERGCHLRRGRGRHRLVRGGPVPAPLPAGGPRRHRPDPPARGGGHGLRAAPLRQPADHDTRGCSGVGGTDPLVGWQLVR